jgi:hypothetical protein
MDLRMSFK